MTSPSISIILRSILICFLIIGIPSCCGNTDLDYVLVESIETEVVEKFDPLRRVFLEYRFDKIYHISNIEISFTGTSSAYALTCDDEGTKGLKPSMDSIVVTSNKKFGSISAGSPLNPNTYVLFTGQLNNDEESRIIETSELPGILNNYNFTRYWNADIYFKVLPDTIEERTFFITTYFRNGVIVTATTGAVKI